MPGSRPKKAVRGAVGSRTFVESDRAPPTVMRPWARQGAGYVEFDRSGRSVGGCGAASRRPSGRRAAACMTRLMNAVPRDHLRPGRGCACPARRSCLCAPPLCCRTPLAGRHHAAPGGPRPHRAVSGRSTRGTGWIRPSPAPRDQEAGARCLASTGRAMRPSAPEHASGPADLGDRSAGPDACAGSAHGRTEGQEPGDGHQQNAHQRCHEAQVLVVADLGEGETAHDDG